MMDSEPSYDYIICGGGTSGCCVAGRLAEEINVKILLIEAGRHNKELENVHMPGGWSKNFDCETDWNLQSAPADGVNGRNVALSRGKFLGGSSGCNGTLCIRGTKQDYDDWDLDGWSGDEVFEYMARTETFHDKDNFETAKEAHGYSGPLHTTMHDLAPISERLRDSMIEKGLPLHPDMFTTGESPHACGYAPRTVYEGTRTTGADFVTNGYHRENVTIRTDTLVDRVVLEKDESGQFVATGVVVVAADGKRETVKAKKEIIVSGGSYCSPGVLMRSGLGDKDELKELGIDVNVDLPGVGKNLADHMITYLFYEVNQPGITNDYLVYHGTALETTYNLWKEKREGFLGTFPFGIFGYARLDERLQDDELWKNAPRQEGRDPMGLTPSQPNIEFFNTECYGGGKFNMDFPIDNKHAFAMLVELFSPRSKGYVKLRSADPTEKPIVQHNYLKDPLDLLVMAEGCKFANEIVMHGSATKDVIKGAWPENKMHHAFTSLEEWKSYVKQNATTCYHPAGTCKMGKVNEDPMAVVDEQLRVKGVKNLRVADVSVMPSLNMGHTQMPAYAIGEKCADLIKGVRLASREGAQKSMSDVPRRDSGAYAK